VRSTHADAFNHDVEADGYDTDVADESNPIRAGYDATLGWVVSRAVVGPQDSVVDLGSGTGNLAVRLPSCRQLVCVDVSARMLELAGPKVGGRAELVQADLLEWFERPDNYDAIVSTYAIHHLTPDERETLIAAAASRLNEGGRFVVGDLMVATRSTIPTVRLRLDHRDVDDFFDEEFPWHVDETVAVLGRVGFLRIAAEQVSDLSWGIAAIR
jgi:putative AdoMet-dependent methyltransferase